MITPAEQKKELRKRFKQIRLNTSGAERQRCGDVLGAYPPRMAQEPKKIIAGYLPFEDEFDVRPLMKLLNQSGHTIALPYQDGDKLGFRSVVFAGGGYINPMQLKVNMNWELGEPNTHCPEVVPQVILLPLIAFDMKGNRLGTGGGYYDRTIAFMRSKGYKFQCIGIAYESQKADAIPHEAHDIPLEAVMTEKTTYRF